MRRAVGIVLALALVGCRPPHDTATRTVRVCAEDDNMPFSNARGEGFEDRIAELLAGDLAARVDRVGLGEGEPVDRDRLEAARCDVLIGVPSRLALAPSTRPYYRTSWVFVTRLAVGEPVRSLDDSRLRVLRVGVPTAGHGVDLPPVHALARRGIVANVRPFPVYSDDANDPAPLGPLRALEAGEIDVAIVWGPHAGWFLQDRGKVAITKVTPENDEGVPFAYDIAMGAHDPELRAELDAFLVRRAPEIDAILRTYGVPR